jgi:hypothetical protein
VPSGDSAIAGWLARSAPSEIVCGPSYDAPWFVERIAYARSRFVPARSSDHATTISSDASAPLGAPLAMSMLGKTSVRAPATPSIVNVPCAGSNCPMPAAVAIARGRSNVLPPSKERAWKNAPWRVWTSLPIQTTKTLPRLSVRIAHPCRPPSWALFTAALICRELQVLPPSVERAKRTGSGRSAPRKPTLQT